MAAMTTPEKPETKSIDQILESLHSEHGNRLPYVETPMGLIACRPPKIGEHKRFTDKIGDQRKSSADAMKELVFCCRAYPDAGAFRSIIETYPALCRGLADALDDAAGGDFEIQTGK